MMERKWAALLLVWVCSEQVAHTGSLVARATPLRRLALARSVDTAPGLRTRFVLAGMRLRGGASESAPSTALRAHSSTRGGAGPCEPDHTGAVGAGWNTSAWTASRLREGFFALQGELAPVAGEEAGGRAAQPEERARLNDRVGNLSRAAIALFRTQMQLASDGTALCEPPSASVERGVLVLFEGIDRSGKGTQVQALSDALAASGRNVSRIGFPRRETATGRMLNNYLRAKGSGWDLDAETLHILFAANRWESALDIVERLNSGQDVILDRYAFSGIAYSVAKGLDSDWCHTWEAGLPAPDLVFFLDVPPEAAARRPGYGQERYERIEFQTRVRDAFSALRRPAEAKEQTAAAHTRGLVRWVVLDGTGTQEEIGRQVVRELAEVRAVLSPDPSRGLPVLPVGSL